MNRALFPFRSCTIAVLASTAVAVPLAAYDTVGNGFGAKWGASPNPGTGAVVTWGFMPDGTPLDPSGFPYNDVIMGTSNISALRNSVDSYYGPGSFNAAVQNAFNTWSAVANINFVGPMTDAGLPVGGTGATSPQIRIGAFQAVPDSWFQYYSALGTNPPGPFFNDPNSGDIIFNVAGIGLVRPFQIAPGTEDVTIVDVPNYGDDIQGLVVHELGHAAMGLHHTRWAGENPDRRVMYVGEGPGSSAPYPTGAINRQLHVDDIAGAQVVYGLRGDYNRNGRVDAADYVLWRNTNGLAVTSGTGADGNVDGAVNATDFTTWRANFGKVAEVGFGEQPSFGEGAGAGVPEPNAQYLIIGGVTGFASTRVRRRVGLAKYC